MLDNTLAVMVMTAPDGRLLRVNQAMCDLLGYDAEALTTRTWNDITHPDDVADSARLVRACLDGEIPGFSFDQRFVHADGRLVSVALVTSLVRDDAGRPVHFATQMIDIKARRTLHAQLRGQPYQCARLLEGLSELGEGVVVDDEGRIVYANDALCGMTGYARDELLAMEAMSQLVASENVQETRALEEGHHVIHGTLDLRRRDGSVAPAEFASIPMRLDGHVGQVTILRDLSEVLQANAALQAAHELKTDLLAMLSHDIAQPLTAVRGYAQLLVHKWDDTTDAKRLMMLRQVCASAERLGEMVAQILAMGQAEGTALIAAPEHVSVATAVEQALALLIDAVPGVSMDEVTNAVVLVDPGHLQQILTNLVGNAGKYGRPPIEVSTRETGDDQVEIRVRDHGEGVPAVFVPHLFDRHTRGTTDATGTGLGLFIVRRLAEANGGEIHYDADASPGACFALRLPAAHDAQKTALPAATGAPG